MDFVNPPARYVLFEGQIAPHLFSAMYRGYALAIGLAGDEVVLEFGCGSGGLSVHLSAQLTAGTLTCVDMSPPMLRIAARRLRRRGNVRCLLGQVPELHLADDSIDVVVSHNALHDVKRAEQPRTAAALARALRPGGRLFLRERTTLPHGMPPAAFRELLGSAGLREVRSREYKLIPVGPVVDAVFVKETPGA